jgi:glycerol-3-phosphate O-acyltransferase / dihydroxyacetone phosphate acyltransferase
VVESEQLQVKGTGNTPVVAKVIDDEHLELTESFGFDITEPRSFMVLAKLNHRQMFDSVYDTLGEGGVIGIFPEGGSHDRPEVGYWSE